jgi:hypothetical protein
MIHQVLKYSLAMLAVPCTTLKQETNRCAVMLPNGPELASCLLACISTCTCVPINRQQMAAEVCAHTLHYPLVPPVLRYDLTHCSAGVQIRSDLLRTGAVAMIVQVSNPFPPPSPHYSTASTFISKSPNPSTFTFTPYQRSCSG